MRGRNRVAFHVHTYICIAARITFVDKYSPCRFWPLSLAIVVICQISERPPALYSPFPTYSRYPRIPALPSSHNRRIFIVVRLVVVVVVDDADIRYEKYEATAITIVAPVGAEYTEKNKSLDSLIQTE